MNSEKNEKIREILSRGVVDVIDKIHLRTRMVTGEKLRIKFGIDPTGPKIHIGRGSTIKKLREFQELGHQIVLIIGDATARIGDSSDKTEGRKSLADKVISNYESNYLSQIGKIIDLDKTEIHHNSEWISKLTPVKLIELASLFTLQQTIERDNFAKRIKKGNPVGYHEGLYCLFQGYDSVAIKSDVEIGGTDQLFNLLAGRKIQKQFRQKPQDIVTLQLLAGTDGRKMSTSWGNMILITDSPEEKYGRIMRISDQLIPVYMECATTMPMRRVIEVKKLLEEGVGNPMKYKKELAYELVQFYDGTEAARRAQNHFESVIQKKKLPKVIPSVEMKSNLLSLNELISHLVRANLITSKSEGKRLIASGSVSIDGVKIKEKSLKRKVKLSPSGTTVRVGKRRFLRLIPEGNVKDRKSIHS